MHRLVVRIDFFFANLLNTRQKVVSPRIQLDHLRVVHNFGGDFHSLVFNLADSFVSIPTPLLKIRVQVARDRKDKHTCDNAYTKDVHRGVEAKYDSEGQLEHMTDLVHNPLNFSHISRDQIHDFSLRKFFVRGRGQTRVFVVN